MKRHEFGYFRGGTTQDDVTSCLLLPVNLPAQRRKRPVPKIAVAEQESGFDLWSSKAKKY